MSTGDIPLDNRPALPTKAELDELAMMIMAYRGYRITALLRTYRSAPLTRDGTGRTDLTDQRRCRYICAICVSPTLPPPPGRRVRKTGSSGCES